MVELGVLIGTGAGVNKDPAEARKLFERAAAAGNPRGATNLAAISSGTGAPADPAQARAMLTKAAEENSAEAEFQLGVMLSEGTGGPKDDVAARSLFEKAAAQRSSSGLDVGRRLCGTRARRAQRIQKPPNPITNEPLHSAMRKLRTL